MELCVLSGQNNLINSFNIQYCKILLLVLMLLTIILPMAELGRGRSLLLSDNKEGQLQMMKMVGLSLFLGIKKVGLDSDS